MMLWRRDRNWGCTCSMHVMGNNIRTITRIKLLTKKPPIAHSAPCSLFLTMLLLRMYESCIEPGHLATMLVNCNWASHMICALIKWKCFLLTYTNSSCDGAFIAWCVQSIASITSAKPALASNCTLILACSTALWEFDIPAEMQIIPSHSAGMARHRVDWLASSLWNAPVARNPSVHITRGHKQRMVPHCCSNAGHSSAHSSRGIALKTADEPVVIMCQQILSISEHTLSSNCTICNVFQYR